jgi:hypothetical protein
MAQHYGAARPHLKGLAEKAWLRGFSVVRLNRRNCDGTEHLHDGYWAECRRDRLFRVEYRAGNRDGCSRSRSRHDGMA